MIGLIQYQLNECPADLFYEILGTRSNFVLDMLTRLVQNVYASPTEHRSKSFYTLLEACERIQTFVKEKFGWEIPLVLDDEDEQGNMGFGQWDTTRQSPVEE